MTTVLPVSSVLPELDQALLNANRAIVVAPPGAGKTTLVPLHLLKAAWRAGKTIILLEPRRLAARAAARRMADILGEKLGETVGYKMRFEQKTSSRTRILVVTEGLFAKMILKDSELDDVACVIFDEFHERSLDADFGLALALDVQDGLRPDLRLIVMSATMDSPRLVQLLNQAPVITSHGQSFHVDVRYQARSNTSVLDNSIEKTMARAIQSTLSQEEGSILAFLPGQKEINQTEKLLRNRVADNVIIMPLYGAMDEEHQDKAIAPAPKHKRKIVLATPIAESSLTIDGIRIVIDSGLERQPIFEPETGITRLETRKASQASIKQRAGRAGRTQDGIAIRLWNEGQNAALHAFSTPEILASDLANLVLDAASFGVHDVSQLALLDTPSPKSLQQARDQLFNLGGLDQHGVITPIGRQMQRLNLPVRLAHMVIKAQQRCEGYQAALLAMVLSEHALAGQAIDLDVRLAAFKAEQSSRARKARAMAKRLSGHGCQDRAAACGRLLVDAFPDRIAKSRGQNGQFLLANGRGAYLDTLSPLARAPYIVAADVAGAVKQGRILAAAEIDIHTLRNVAGPMIKVKTATHFDRQSGYIKAEKQQKLGAIVLHTEALPTLSADEANRAIINAIHALGIQILPWQPQHTVLLQRLQWLHQKFSAPWPAMDNNFLQTTCQHWLLPFLSGHTNINAIAPNTLYNGLMSYLPYDLQRQIDSLAPTHYDLKTNEKIPIHYDGKVPTLSLRVQKLFGLKKHPTIANGMVPLVLELLSPARRPIQITTDLPRFWAGSWADIRREMRGRYPKHFWPEDPANQAAPSKAKKTFVNNTSKTS